MRMHLAFLEYYYVINIKNKQNKPKHETPWYPTFNVLQAGLVPIHFCEWFTKSEVPFFEAQGDTPDIIGWNIFENNMVFNRAKGPPEIRKYSNSEVAVLFITIFYIGQRFLCEFDFLKAVILAALRLDFFLSINFEVAYLYFQVSLRILEKRRLP